MFVFGLAVGVFVATLCWGFKIARRNNSGGKMRNDATDAHTARTASAKNRAAKGDKTAEVDIRTLTDSLGYNSSDVSDGDDDNEHTSGLRKRKQ